MSGRLRAPTASDRVAMLFGRTPVRSSLVRAARMTCETLERRQLLSADVLTYHNDNSSTGQNLAETVLTPTDVNVNQFGKIFAAPLDGQVYAQPLVKTGVNITTGQFQGTHDVVFVATQHDSLYAFDAQSGVQLWHDSFINPAGGVTSVPSGDVNTGDISPEIGITSTPVIDPSTSILYLTAKTKEVRADGNHYVYRLHAIDIGSGAEALGGPAIMGDTLFNGGYTYRTILDPYVPGTGDGAITVGGQSRVYFNALRQMNRPGLTLANGTIYIAFASHGDNGPYHGWILGYNPANLQLTAVLNLTPNGGLGGIWQGGGKVDVDSQGNLYVETGNGTFDTTLTAQGFPSKGDYGDSFVKIAPDPTTGVTHQNINGWGLKVVDFFTPFDQQNLNNGDTDQGSGASTLLPDSVGSQAHPHLMVGSGKTGIIYLLDRDNLGKFDPNTNHVVQELPGAISGSLSTPAFYNNTIYYGPGYGGNAVTYSISNGLLSSAATSTSPDGYGFPGSTPSISSNGGTNGVVWDIDHGSNQLRVYNANSYAQELWTSDKAPGGRDSLGSSVKFEVPTVANGMVYVGTNNLLVGFGALVPATGAPAAPSNLQAQLTAPAQITLTFTDNAKDETGFVLERSTDQTNWVKLTTLAPLPGTGLTGNYVDNAPSLGTTFYYRVRAINGFNGESQSDNSNIASATTQASGAGAEAHYYNTNFWVGSPVINTIVPTVDFAWGTGSPDPAINTSNYSTAFTGKVHTDAAGTYTFISNSDDDGYLYVNGVLVSSDPGSHGAEEPPAANIHPIVLAANSWYNFVFLENQGQGAADAHMEWIEPNGAGGRLAETIIPQSHLNSLSDIPAAPTNLLATSTTSNSVTLSFTDNATSEFKDVLERSTDGFVNSDLIVGTAGVNANTIHDTTALPNMTYQYRVKATNFDGQSGYSNVVTVTTTAPVGQPGVELHYFADRFWYGGGDPHVSGNPDLNTTAATVNVDWGGQPPATGIPGVLFSTQFTGTIHADTTGKYTFISNTDDDGYLWVNGVLVSQDPGLHAPEMATNLTPINLTAGQNYDFIFVMSQNQGGAAAHMFWVTPGITTPVIVPQNHLTTVSDVPAAPTGLALSGVSASQITLTWKDNSTSEIHYVIERSTDGVNFTQIAQTGFDVTRYTDTGLAQGTQYSYQVRGINYDGAGAYSNVATATTIQTGSGGMLGGAEAAASSDTDLTARGPRDWAAWGLSSAITFDHDAAASEHISDLTLLAGASRNALANSPATFTWSNGTPDASATQASLGVFSTGTNGAGFQITAPADQTTRVLRVWVAETNAIGQLSAKLSDGSAAAFIDSSIVPNPGGDVTVGVYTIVYHAGTGSTNQLLDVDWTILSSQTGGGVAILAAALGNPGDFPAPTHLVAESCLGGVVHLTWDDNTDGESGFGIEQSNDGGATWNQIAVVAPNHNYYELSGLNGTTSYQFRVRALSANPTAYSNVASIVATGQPDIDHSGGFTSAGDLTLNGNAALTGTGGTPTNALELTPDVANQDGSAFSTNRRGIEDFDSSFDFRFTDPNADGFTFTIQNVGPTALGAVGGSLGYQGIPRSVAIKFDIYPSLSTTGLYTEGNQPGEDQNAIDLVSSGIDFHANSADTFRAHLTYDDTTLHETITDLTTNAVFTHDYTIDIPATVGETCAYVGFTGATGGSSAQQDILNWSYKAMLPPIPSAPKDLVATPTSGTQVNLTWSEVGSNASGFALERGTDPNGPFTQIATVPDNQHSYLDTGLTPGAQYIYRIRATSDSGGSAYSDQATVTLPTPPITPSGAHATLIGTGEVDLAWKDNSNNEDGWRIFRRTGGNTFALVAQLPVNSTTYNDTTGLLPGTPYDYHIQAYNIAGYSDFTGASVQTLTLAPAQVQSAATNKLTLNWTAPVGAATYNIYRSTTPGGEGATPIATGISVTTFSDTAVNPNTTYYYQVTGIDGGGESARSSEISAKALFTGDINADGKVGFADLVVLAANYGKTSGVGWAQGDLNGDGAVNFNDLVLLAANYGAGAAGATTATPAASASAPVKPALVVHTRHATASRGLTAAPRRRFR